jgi:ABC-type hemin transport system ATPase subunit
VMHDLDLTFRFFENVIVMDAGRIVAQGRAWDIFDDKRLDAAFGVEFERRRRLATVSCGRSDASSARLPLVKGARARSA